MNQVQTTNKKGAAALPKAPLTNDPKDLILKDLEIEKQPNKSSSKKNEMSSLKKFDKFKK